jgi:DNA-binding response OmpR family regulator
VEVNIVGSETKKESPMLVVCPHCQTSIKIQVDLSLKLETPETVVEPQPAVVSKLQLDHKRVAIAINGEGTREIIKEMLEDANFEVNDVSSLEALFPILKEFSPATVLVDLSLPNATTIRLGEAVGKELSPERPRLILVSPGYGKSNISPEKQISFSGANDYIERGNIQRDLVRKIKTYLDSVAFLREPVEKVVPLVAPSPVEEVGYHPVEAPFPIYPTKEKAPEMREEETPVLEQGGLEAVSESPAVVSAAQSLPLFTSEEVHFKEMESARRLARIIVSDIILYNEKKVEEGVLNGTFYDLLKEEIDEGRKHYNSRVSLDIQKERDYLGDVFEDFLKKKRAVSTN